METNQDVLRDYNKDCDSLVNDPDCASHQLTVIKVTGYLEQVPVVLRNRLFSILDGFNCFCSSNAKQALTALEEEFVHNDARVCLTTLYDEPRKRDCWPDLLLERQEIAPKRSLSPTHSGIFSIYRSVSRCCILHLEFLRTNRRNFVYLASGFRLQPVPVTDIGHPSTVNLSSMDFSSEGGVHHPDQRHSHSEDLRRGSDKIPARFQNVPEPRHLHHRYFENPFPEYSGMPLRDPSQYLEDALGLLRDIYHYFSGVNLGHTETDIYTGTAGVAYACHRLSTQNLKEANRHMALRLADRCLDSALRHRSREQGFLTGDPGVLVVSAIFYKSVGNLEKAEDCLQEYVKICATVDTLKVKDSTGDEMFAGRVGYLAGLLELWKAFPNNKVLSHVDVGKIVEAVVLSGRHYSKKKKLQDTCPLYFYHYGTDYLGAAHGISAILQILLCFPEALLSVRDAENDVRKSVNYVLCQQLTNGNFSATFGETDREDLVHWCHGAPGVIYMLAKAYLFWNDKTYLEACGRCSELIWRKGLLRKGSGMCHGISGNGYSFLLMYRLTGNEMYLYRAHCFADFQFLPSVLDKSRTPDNPYSLFEGVSGAVCFLTDLVSPANAAFPFFDIFTDFKSTVDR